MQMQYCCDWLRSGCFFWPLFKEVERFALRWSFVVVLNVCCKHRTETHHVELSCVVTDFLSNKARIKSFLSCPRGEEGTQFLQVLNPHLLAGTKGWFRFVLKWRKTSEMPFLEHQNFLLVSPMGDGRTEASPLQPTVAELKRQTLANKETESNSTT